MTNTWQSWANVLDEIKTELGADVVKLEVSDQQIIKKLYDHVLPEFSSYSGLSRYYKVTDGHLISTDPIRTYQIKDFDYRILGINGKIDKSSYIDMQMNQMQHMSGDISDFLIRQNYLDISNMVRADDSYRFIAPNQVQLIKASLSYFSSEFILDLDCVHKDPSTIDTTLYKEFTDLSVAYCLNWIGKIRKKFSNVSTPFGEIQLNADEMIQEGKELKRTTLEALLRTPNSQIVWVL